MNKMLSLRSGFRYTLQSLCRRTISTTQPFLCEKVDNESATEDAAGTDSGTVTENTASNEKTVESITAEDIQDPPPNEELNSTGAESSAEELSHRPNIHLILSHFQSRCGTTQTRETIGFIGLGNMGSVMGMNLLKNGHKLVIYDVSSKAMEPFKSEDVILASSPEEVAQQAKKIITVLPSSEDVKEVYRGNRGIFNCLQKGTILIDSSTIDPALAKDINTAAAAYDSVYIDAPMSGGVDAAAQCKLTFMCGGTTENFRRVEPLLGRMGREVVLCGDTGCGQSAKLCNNMLLAISMIGTSEVLNLGGRLGLQGKALTDIINMSTGRCWSSEEYNPCPGVHENAPSSKKYQGGFSSNLMAKDLGLAQNKATETRTSAPLGSVAHQVYNMMCKSGYSKLDFSSVYKFLRES